MLKVQQTALIKKNFWKRRVAKAVITPFDNNGFEYNIELYSFNKRFLCSKVIPYYQLSEELKSLGLGEYYVYA